MRRVPEGSVSLTFRDEPQREPLDVIGSRGRLHRGVRPRWSSYGSIDQGIIDEVAIDDIS